jgi:HAD superfamily hydrolase (TIGR01509 family)
VKPPAGSEALPAAVLWDMDGTLVDTEPYWMDAEYALVSEHGGRWSEEQARALVGNPLPVSAEVLHRAGGVGLPPEVIVERLIDRVVADVRRHLPWRPGAQELLRALRAADVPCALVTMSYARLTDAVVSTLPAGTFAAVVPGDQVRHGKPHPEPYLTAARRLGVAPQDCVAIEDSRTGAASAHAAGAAVVAVPHVVPVPPAPGIVVVDTLEGLSPAGLSRLAGLARRAAS